MATFITRSDMENMKAACLISRYIAIDISCMAAYNVLSTTPAVTYQFITQPLSILPQCLMDYNVITNAKYKQQYDIFHLSTLSVHINRPKLM